MTLRQRLVRMAVLVVAWALPVAGPMAGVRIVRALVEQPAQRLVNMFGLTDVEHSGMVWGLFAGLLGLIVLPLVLRQGILWLPVAIGVAVAVMVLMAVLAPDLDPDNPLLGVISVSILFLPPLLGSLVPRPRRWRRPARAAA